MIVNYLFISDTIVSCLLFCNAKIHFEIVFYMLNDATCSMISEIFFVLNNRN